MMEMKRVADAKKLRLEVIKRQKKQSSGSATYIDKTLDFLEKQLENSEYPKTLIEDIEWAIEIISDNKLYSGNLGLQVVDFNRPEIRF